MYAFMPCHGMMSPWRVKKTHKAINNARVSCLLAHDRDSDHDRMKIFKGIPAPQKIQNVTTGSKGK